MADPTSNNLTIEQIINDVLATIEREREREIISRRFGLFDRKETLEQIGELLGITRERVRQLEKAVVARLKAQADRGQLPHLPQVQQKIKREVENLGNIARVQSLAKKLTKNTDRISQSRIAFLAELSPDLAVIEDSDHYHHSVGIKSLHDEKQIKNHVAEIIDAVKGIGEPTDINAITSKVSHDDPKHVSALAGISKQLATLNERWGLVKWPMVNPKNIRDKIYVILHEAGRHMHFNEISDAIKQSEFKRKDVTTQAIHNELIKDSRFVLIGRGIYALKEWGYSQGTVADVIAKVLRQNGEPMHRDDIVREVLKSRQVKETTILLNLQGKPQFKRVAKATYSLAE